MRAFAESEGLDVAQVLSDDGLSGRKARANADEALRMLDAGEADALLVWKLDRWTRQGLGAIGRLVEVLDRHPKAEFIALRDGIRSTQPSWRLTAAVLSEVARSEADNTAMRVSAAIRDNQQKGRFKGGTVPYGYSPAPHPSGRGRTLILNPAEVATIKRMADWALDGRPINGLIDILTNEGVPTTRSPYRLATLRGEDAHGLARGVWSWPAVAAILTGDAVLGRVSVGSPIDGTRRKAWSLVLDEAGLPLQAFPAALDVETSARLRDRIKSSKIPSGKPRRVPRKARLLSGLLWCGVCGKKLWVTVRSGRSTYTCSRKAGGTCPAPNMTAELAERAITDTFLAERGHWPEAVLEESVHRPEHVDELARVQAAIDQTAAQMTHDDADVARLATELQTLKGRRTELQAAPVTIERRWIPTGRTIAEAWADGDDHTKRGLLERFGLDRIDLLPTETRGSNVFQPERLVPHWIDVDDPDAPDSLGRGLLIPRLSAPVKPPRDYYSRPPGDASHTAG
ncbi:recombinase-like zinc beta ribbon protein [Microbacterium lacticum]|uniref:Recombinase-like zinc beta ribbon protein n=1 Tax=Microbacterium lacticum TaxID=33885 RepID=A0A543L094_9MICO|nr:recombinase-like zinc beta ribbon protein [Microbacterium lacticum]